MSTYITVTSDTSRLVDQVQQVQLANRDALLESEHDAKFQERAEAELTEARTEAEGPRGGNPDTRIDRRPAAHRSGSLQPFAISWKGLLTEGVDITNVFVMRAYVPIGTSSQFYDNITTRHQGLRELSQSSIRFASKADAVFVSEQARTERWRTTVITCPESTSPTSCQTSWQGILTHQFPNYWLTDTVDPNGYMTDPYVHRLDAPEITLPVGPLAYTPSTSIVTVAEDGTVYLVFDLPDKPQTLESHTMWGNEYFNAGSPNHSVVAYSPFEFQYAVWYENWKAVGSYIRSERTERRFLFIKSTATSMESKVAELPEGDDLSDFLYENLYVTDPSREVRKEGYLGEYRIRGTAAKFLRLRLAADSYRTFPYNFLTDYKNDKDLPELPSGVRFEDYSYSVDLTVPPAVLAAELTRLSTTTTDPALRGKTSISASPALFFKAKQNLGSDPGEEITPYLYIAIGQ